jgi:hypothetical protein
MTGLQTLAVIGNSDQMYSSPSHILEAELITRIHILHKICNVGL